MTNDGDALPKDRLLQPTTLKWFYAIMGVALAYSIVRYHVADAIPWRHFPLFILNKATAIAAVAFVSCSYLVGKVFRWHDEDKVLRLVVIKFCGLMGFFLACIHAFFSFFLLTPAYFAKYYDAAGKLNWQGELGMCVGILGLFFLLSPAVTTLPMMPKALGGKRWKRSQRMGYLALALTVSHLVVLGYKGWMMPAKWPGSLPPISLIAVLIAIVPLFVKQRLRSAEAAKESKRL